MKSILTLTVLIYSTSVMAQKYCCHDEQEASFDGNDLISYYDGKILKGNTAYQVDHEGQILFFNSKENKDRFLEDPSRYIPSYGGWCSIAMSLDALVKPNYNYYRFDNDGRVMFFEVRAFLNGITLWEKDTLGNKIKADINYQKLLEYEQ